MIDLVTFIKKNHTKFGDTPYIGPQWVGGGVGTKEDHKKLHVFSKHTTILLMEENKQPDIIYLQKNPCFFLSFKRSFQIVNFFLNN